MQGVMQGQLQQADGLKWWQLLLAGGLPSLIGDNQAEYAGNGYVPQSLPAPGLSSPSSYLSNPLVLGAAAVIATGFVVYAVAK